MEQKVLYCVHKQEQRDSSRRFKTQGNRLNV